MKLYIKYGGLLAIIFILHSIIFFFWKQSMLFEKFSQLYLWYLFLYIIFMLLAIFDSRKTIQDSGTYFKIALVTYCLANFSSNAFDSVLFNTYATELNPIYLEEEQKGLERWGQLTGQDALKNFEEVALMDKTIEENFALTDFLKSCFAFFTLIGIPLSILTTFIAKQLIRIQQKGFYWKVIRKKWTSLLK